MIHRTMGMTESCLFSHDQCLRCPITVIGMGVLHGYHESAFGAAFLVGLFLLFLGKGTELLIFSSCLGAATSSSAHFSIFFCHPSCLELKLVGSASFLPLNFYRIPPYNRTTTSSVPCLYSSIIF